MEIVFKQEMFWHKKGNLGECILVLDKKMLWILIFIGGRKIKFDLFVKGY